MCAIKMPAKWDELSNGTRATKIFLKIIKLLLKFKTVTPVTFFSFNLLIYVFNPVSIAIMENPDSQELEFLEENITSIHI